MSEHEINLINLEKITEYLNKFAHGSKHFKILEEYLSLALEKPLRKDKKYLQPVDRLPDDAPEWLIAKWDSTVFHEFVPNTKLDSKIAHIKDWIEACLVREEAWLNSCDEKNRPLKLLKIGSVEQAMNMAEKDRERWRLKSKVDIQEDAAFEYEISHGDISVVKEFADGFFMVQILTKVGAARESYLMQHCIGDGAYDDLFMESNPESESAFYSLRSKNNKPHVTLQIDLLTKEVEQCVGRQNVPPSEKYMPRILEFLEEFEFIMTHSIQTGRYIYDAGKAYPICDLPKNFEFNGDLDITYLMDFVCPDNLIVKGNFILDTLQRPFIKPCLKVEGFIDENHYIDAHNCKVIRYKYDFDHIYSEKWYFKEFASKHEWDLHSENEPACIDYDIRTGNIIGEKWYMNGKLHRDSGPARRSWNSITGELIGEGWYLNGDPVQKQNIK